MILAKIGATLTWLGDPYTIPLPHLPHWWEECERVNLWKRGEENDKYFADLRQRDREIEAMVALARRSRRT